MILLALFALYGLSGLGAGMAIYLAGLWALEYALERREHARYEKSAWAKERNG